MIASAFLLLIMSCDASKLRHRPESTPVAPIDGKWIEPFKGALAGRYLLFHNGAFVTIRGKGYFRIRNEYEYWIKPGEIRPIRLHDIKGTAIHVASGGGRKMNDEWTGEPGRSGLGRPGMKSSFLAPGTKPNWRNEFYYLDGTVTVRLDEGPGVGATNYSVTPVTYADIVKDITQALNLKENWLRHGEVHDRC